MRGGLALVAALALAGCGGSSSTSSTQSSAPTPTVATQPKSAEGQEAGSHARRVVPHESSRPAPTDPDPLSNEGSSAPAPGVPTAKGGDNSIQTYGLEASSSERVEVASLVQAYLGAQAAGHWSEACSLLSTRIRRNLEALGRRVKDHALGCEKTMAALTARVPRATLHRAAEIHVLSLRARGARAFAIYRDGTERPCKLPLVREGGSWKVAAVAGSPLAL